MIIIAIFDKLQGFGYNLKKLGLSFCTIFFAEAKR